MTKEDIAAKAEHICLEMNDYAEDHASPPFECNHCEMLKAALHAAYEAGERDENNFCLTLATSGASRGQLIDAIRSRVEQKEK